LITRRSLAGAESRPSPDLDHHIVKHLARVPFFAISLLAGLHDHSSANSNEWPPPSTGAKPVSASCTSLAASLLYHGRYVLFCGRFIAFSLLDFQIVYLMDGRRTSHAGRTMFAT